MLQATTRYRRRAAELLDAAKRAVEIAIEFDEATPFKFLDAMTEGVCTST